MMYNSAKKELTRDEYNRLYQQSITNPEQFWADCAKQFISFSTPFVKTMTGNFTTNDVDWYVGGKLNACYNCIDRHIATRGNQAALIFEGNEPDTSTIYTYNELHTKICKFANVLKNQGVKKGDRVAIYMPMVPEAVIAMLSCARIGAVHSVIFGGFSAEALSLRIQDAECKVIITADESQRGDKTIAFKTQCDKALLSCSFVNKVIVIKHSGKDIPWDNARDIWYHEAMLNSSAICPVEPMEATDPLFILYTSGSTGNPKGVLHTTGGYLVYVAMTYYYLFHQHANEVHFCTADIGWITGHSYVVYGPLANGSTTLLFEGIPNYPNFSRYWDIIDKHQVNIFYTAPTALRALRREGDEWVKNSKRTSLCLLGTVGEPINPSVWDWYYNVVGEGRCPIINTWWQTETGGVLLTPFPFLKESGKASVGLPFFGILPEIVDSNGIPLANGIAGQLIIKAPWPGLMQTLYRNQQRFIDTYFKTFPGFYLTGDGAYQDNNGQYYITGRNDDVINVSGHRIGTEEIESALLTHPAVAEAAVVGIAHPIKGQAIFAFVTHKQNIIPNDKLKQELILHIRAKIGPIATPEEIKWASSLPKTRSGKIMRRILQKIANNDVDNLGDISTLADASVIAEIIKE